MKNGKATWGFLIHCTLCQISVLTVAKSVRTSNLLFLQNSRKRKCSLESHFKKSDSSFHPCTKYDHM